MLTKVCFDRCMNTLLAFAEIEISPEKNKAFYSLMKNDFSDDEFRAISEDICKTELLYGKYPAPKLFYDRKKSSEENILVEVGTFYLDETIPEYKEAFAGLSFDESDKLGTAVWNWIMKNKKGEMISKQFVVDRIKQFRPQSNGEEPITLTEIKKLIAEHNNPE